MAAAVELPPVSSSSTTHPTTDTHACPTCGTSLDMAAVEDAQNKIKELEAQMELLKEKATAAVDKCADYEDQLRSLKSTPALPRTQTSQSDSYATPSRPSTAVDADQARPTTASSTTNKSRFSFLTSRFPSPANTGSMPPPPPPKDTPQPQQQQQQDQTLHLELERERALRAKAEARCEKVDSEIEELSVQLFSQANEMVAEERRARAKLEERVELLERRDREKAGRLERLEKAVTRVERVKALLGKEAEEGGVGVGVGGLLSPKGR